jgi:transposase InsO family protein
VEIANIKRASVIERLMIIESARTEGVSAASRKHRCCRTTVYALLARYQAGRMEALVNRPRGPRAPIPRQIEEAIVGFKLDLLSRSTAKIQQLVHQGYGRQVSRQTVWRVLSARGLARITDPVPLVRFSRLLPNDLWQFDLMEDEATAIGKVHLPVLVDDATRFCLAGRFVRCKAQPAVLGVLAEAMRICGLPQEILTDRAKMFYGPTASHQGLTVYQLALQTLGIRAAFSKPYKARTKGKVEKFIQFVQRDFLSEVRDKVRSLEDLNARFKRWRAWYNYERPHSSLGQGAPGRSYHSSARLAPAELERLLSVTEPRRVGRDASISVAGQRYPVPAEYMGRHVWVAMLKDQIRIEHGGKTIAEYTR